MSRLKSFLLTYKYVAGMETKRLPVRENHLKHAVAHEPLGLMLGGALQLPIDTGILLWKVENEDLVRNFVVRDPYFQAGLIESYSIREYVPVVGQLKDQLTN